MSFAFRRALASAHRLVGPPPASGAAPRCYSKRWLAPIARDPAWPERRSALPWGFGSALEEASSVLGRMVRALEEPLYDAERRLRGRHADELLPASASSLLAAVDEPDVRLTRDGFSVAVDVHHFEPDDVRVKVCDGALVVTARHAAKADRYGSVTREMVREFAIPDEVDQQSFVCKLTPDGHVRVEAKLKAEGAGAGERVLEMRRESNDAAAEVGEKKAGPAAAAAEVGDKKKKAGGCN